MRPSLLLLSALLAVPAAALAQDERPSGSVRAWEHETSDVPVDARLNFGRFDNGMRWVWADNPEPDNRVYVRLHVDIGAFAERPDEDGMAHFLEHMGFNGTKNFEAGTLIEWFQEQGMAFGADTNAHTAFSETVYKLDLPNPDEDTLRSGLEVLSDFAFEMILSEEEIDAEKGVIDGEQRERDSAGYRMQRKIMQTMYAGTRYADVTIIGAKDIRAAFDSDLMTAFYRRWYRPENMTLVIVGDLGELDPEPLMAEYFAGYEAPGDPVLPEPPIGTPTMDTLSFAVYEPEIPVTTISVEMLRAYEDEPYTREEMTEDLDLSFARSMLNLRYRELTKKEDTPFLNARVGGAGGLEVFEGASLSITTDPGKWKESLAAADAELRRALEFGFQQAELDEIRANYLRGLDEAVDRMPTRSSRSILNEVLGAVENRFVPTDARTYRAIMKPVAESVTLEQCHEALVEDWSEGELALYAMGNLDLGDKGGRKLLSAYVMQGLDAVEAPEEIELAPFAYESDPETTGEVVSREHVEDLDVHLVRFANGVKLNVKPTDFKDKQILVRGRLAEGGLTLDPSEYVTSMPADSIVNGGGLGEHSADDLRRIMAGKQVGVGFGVAEDAFVLNGVTTPEDVLLEFEMMCAYLNDAGWREDGLVRLRQFLPVQYEQLKTQLFGPLINDFLPALHGGDPRFVAFPEMSAVLDVGVDDVREWIEPHLAAGPLEVTVVGDVDVDEIVEFAARTFGTLPSRREPLDVSAHLETPPLAEGLRMTRAVPTEDEKSLVMVAFPTTDGIEAGQRRSLGFLGTVLNDRVRQEIRERLGAAYSPGAGSQANTVFPGVGWMMIQANADPGKVDALVDACLDVAVDLAENGVTAEETHRLAEPLLNRLRDQRRQNDYWAGGLAESQSDPSALDDLRDVEAFYRDLEPAALSELAKRYLVRDRASVLVVNPEQAEQTAN